jgi:hypothetical protein
MIANTAVKQDTDINKTTFRFISIHSRSKPNLLKKAIQLEFEKS